MTSTVERAEDADTAAFQGLPQRRLFLPLFVFAYFGVALAAVSAPAVSIPLRLSELDPEHKTQMLSLTVAVGGVLVVLITAPLGRFSDASTARSGIRRPFILGGSLLGTVGMLVLALAPNIPVIMVGWILSQAGFASTNMALNALLADQIPARIRARVAAMFGLSTGIAPVIGSSLVGALPGDPLYWFGIPAAIALGASLGVVLVLKDIVRTRATPVDWRSLLRSYWINPLRHKDFAWAWVCRLLITMSLFTVITYLLYFLTDQLGIDSEDAPSAQGTVLGVYFVFSVVTTLVFGWVSDRTGRRKTIVWTSALLTALGLLISLFAHDLTSFCVGIALAGMGQGAFVSVDVAMMTELLPDLDSAGTGQAVIALSYQLPALIVPGLATLLLAIGDGGPNYIALFTAAVIASAAGGLAVLPIKNVR
ncbi:MFS transporter [Streptomyces flavofungini]|uniref:MFS transporter n=1 Tax=Streptomyces flavofungini TaxID=68200 RepID=UPI0034DEB0BB